MKMGVESEGCECDRQGRGKCFRDLWMDGVVDQVLVVRAWDMYSDSASLTPHARPHLLAASYLPPFKSAHNAKKLMTLYYTNHQNPQLTTAKQHNATLTIHTLNRANNRSHHWTENSLQ